MMRRLLALSIMLAPSTALHLPHASSRRGSISRREVQLRLWIAAASGACTALLTEAATATGNVLMTPDAAAGAKMDGSIKAAKTPIAARDQIVAGYRALGALLENYDAVIAAEGGDGIRRVIGTVGTASPCYLIEPAFRLLFEADDSLPMEYIDSVEKIMLGLSSADGDAYSANFITFSSAKGKPEDFYKRAATSLVGARKEWATLMSLLDLKP
mmetsp:Transcript_26568/g.57345  ORF Transcript_26568/g.57345 Transcript_26568/m.57345 type:complete len:214 (-) Transcript_26568:312-953(-)|eukprot:CAMPEP_0183378764 /NCGR_PEP_ID=MMETSP0164_2-20130417/125086_1 /TAXON_ID=221442 /ORGANISM="Coccolithus pelagicus ssp braarudi, Strain PLY182g" /LENGTH=213 /DNA_ID=CAMNT_0025556337 /DNA_START=13 /DNA_END=654 /DNA_ORIENTATION=-